VNQWDGELEAKPGSPAAVNGMDDGSGTGELG